MMAIVLLLALASTAFADEYTPHYQFRLVEGEKGNFGIEIAGFTNYGCISAGGMSINDFAFSVDSSKWQRRADENDSWADVPGTIGENQVCGLSNPTLPGEYRWVAQIVVYRRVGENLLGARQKIASANTLVVAGDPETEDESAAEETGDESAVEDAGDETAVEAVTWGFIKSRATR